MFWQAEPRYLEFFEKNRKNRIFCPLCPVFAGKLWGYIWAYMIYSDSIESALSNDICYAAMWCYVIKLWVDENDVFVLKLGHFFVNLSPNCYKTQHFGLGFVLFSDRVDSALLNAPEQALITSTIFELGPFQHGVSSTWSYTFWYKYAFSWCIPMHSRALIRNLKSEFKSDVWWRSCALFIFLTWSFFAIFVSVFFRNPTQYLWTCDKFP